MCSSQLQETEATLQHQSEESFDMQENDQRSTEKYISQDHQALLKAKYCPRVAAASRTQKKKQKPTWPSPLTDDLDIQ